jgi:alkylhydroperoxidase family enzyme
LEASGNDLDIVRLVANSPNVFRPFILFADALMTRATLPSDVREVVVMHLAARRQSNYEWKEHETISQRAGVTYEQLAAIQSARYTADLFSEDQLLAVAIADELLAGAGLRSAAWINAIQHWQVEGALDLVFTVGWWGALVPLIIEALALDTPMTKGNVADQ